MSVCAGGRCNKFFSFSGHFPFCVQVSGGCLFRDMSLLATIYVYQTRSFYNMKRHNRFAVAVFRLRDILSPKVNIIPASCPGIFVSKSLI